ncbi:MAG: hypothetical protein ACFFAU_07315 [Candidatus Hodarchaeota archaeon]
MIEEILINILTTFLQIFVSIPFGAVLITIGVIIYAPTGSRFGKYCLIIGLLIFTINNFTAIN